MAEILDGFLCNYLLVRLDSNYVRKDWLKSKSTYSNRPKVWKPYLASQFQKSLS